MGARCELCGQDMLESKGCTVADIHIGGKIYKRIPVGGMGDYFEGASADARCGDCGAQLGHYHHWVCDCERCPACGRQLISCSCEDVFAQGKR